MTDARPAVYLDHAATTSMTPAALDAYAACAGLGNPSSPHAAGREARRVVEESRERIAAAVGATPSEVVFTGGGTEADNLAVQGAYRAAEGRRRLVVSAVEHHAVLEPAQWLAGHEGATVVLAPVDGEGRLDLAALAAELDAHGREIALVSVMWANNEIGTVQPVAEVARLARAAGAVTHSDAVQAVGQVPVDFAASGLDAMTITAHKLGGPVGIGALIARRDLRLEPVQHGGGQERGVRSGTLDAAGACAFATAVEEAVGGLAARAVRLRALRDRLIDGVLAAVPGAVLDGPADRDGRDTRLPGNVHFRFPGADGDALVLLLDAAGICASTGSACQAGVNQPSHVLAAIGVPADEARGVLRLSLAAVSTAADVEAALAVLPDVVARARGAAGRAA